MISVRDVHGRSPSEAIIELFIIISVAPLIVCCIVQAVTLIAAIVLPWVAITVMVIGVVACVAALFAAGGRNRPRLPPPPGPAGGVGGDMEPVLPIRRPPGLPAPGQGREH